MVTVMMVLGQSLGKLQHDVKAIDAQPSVDSNNLVMLVTGHIMVSPGHIDGHPASEWPLMHIFHWDETASLHEGDISKVNLCR